MGERTEPVGEPLLADRGELVRHGLAALAAHRHVGFARIQALDVRGERYDLDPVQKLIRRVIADDDGGALLPDLTAHGRREIHPPDLTAVHRRRPRSWPPTTCELPPRALRQPP